MLDKKGQAFEQLGKLALGVVTLAIILVVGFMVITQGKDQMAETDGYSNASTCDTAGCNASDDLSDGLGNLPDWIPIVIIVGIGVVLIGMVKMFGRR